MKCIDIFLQEGPVAEPKPAPSEKTDYKIVMERLRKKRRFNMERCVGMRVKQRTICELQALQEYLKGCTNVKYLMQNNGRSTLILDKKIYNIKLKIANKQYQLSQMG